MITTFKVILGLLMIFGGIFLGFYIGLCVCFIGGIAQVIQSIYPIIFAKGIAIGIAKVLFAGAAGWISALILMIPGVVLVQGK